MTISDMEQNIAEEEQSENVPQEDKLAQEASPSGRPAEIYAQMDDVDALAGSDDQEDQSNERDELKEQLLRLMADNENLRKRTEKEVAAAKKYGAMAMARDLLASFDNLEKAVELIPEDKSDFDETMKNILIGVEMTAREFASSCERHGITIISPEGQKFDYNLHQAMFEVPTDEVAAGTVVTVVQKGYQLHDRLLRPAMVGVSKAADKPAQETTENTDKD